MIHQEGQQSPHLVGCNPTDYIKIITAACLTNFYQVLLLLQLAQFIIMLCHTLYKDMLEKSKKYKDMLEKSKK